MELVCCEYTKESYNKAQCMEIWKLKTGFRCHQNPNLSKYVSLGAKITISSFVHTQTHTHTHPVQHEDTELG
jgi:hypothetical protein